MKHIKKTIEQQNELFSLSLKRNEDLFLKPSSTNQRKHIYDITYFNISPINNYIYINNNEQSNNVNTNNGSNHHTNDVHLRHMENSFADIGLSITSKPLAKFQKLSVETVLNSSFPRVNDKQQITRNSKTFNVLNNERTLPYLNESILSGGTSARLNQTHNHAVSSFISTNLRQANIKSSSKEIDSINNQNSILSNSNQFSRTRSFFLNNSNDNINKSLNFPIKPTEALSYYGNKLNQYEKMEIFDYNEIYFLGLEAEKISATNIKDYDDENGCYIKINKDHICYRFEILETLGKGSFGLVLKCYDHKKKEAVALKIIRNKKRFQQQGLVEVNILTHLKTLDQQNNLNIVHIKEHFYFRSHLCITFELLGINLYELIKKNNYQGFSIHLVRRFANSLLQCLQIMFTENIIHCDLKPENILLRQKGSSHIKLIDFGSGCFQSQRIYTYIQSRFYRAPEIILGIPYTTAIDMWSLACILVELFTGYPIFPGENEQEQLSMIMEVIDLPPNHILQQGTRKKLFFDSKGIPRNISTKTSKKRRPGSRPLGEILRTSDTHFVDFIRRCFQWDPIQRLTPEEGLRHPWIIQTKLKRTSYQTKNKYQTKKDQNYISTHNTDSYFSLNETTENEETIENEDDKQQSLSYLPRISNQ